jgi:hypothetical protein
MKKNILDSEGRQAILSRIEKLTPESKALWGKMNVRQTLRHMRFGYQMPLGEISEPEEGGVLKKKIMKFFLLNVPAPKEKAETYPSFNTVSLGIDPPDFEAERRELKEYIQRFSEASSLLENNPMAGKFQREDWGRLMYNHCDHHLKQFGV